jgi:hypothetical protein
MASESKIAATLEERLKAMELQVRALNVGGAALGRLAAFSSGSCTNECTAACTIGCTNGCTGGCVAESPVELDMVARTAEAARPADIGGLGVALYARLKGQPG